MSWEVPIVGMYRKRVHGTAVVPGREATRHHRWWSVTAAGGGPLWPMSLWAPLHRNGSKLLPGPRLANKASSNHRRLFLPHFRGRFFKQETCHVHAKSLPIIIVPGTSDSF